MLKNIGLVGLGLIGGCLAKTVKEKTQYHVYAADANEEVLAAAMEEGCVAGPLTKEQIGACDVILLALYPGGIISYMEENLSYIKKGTIVVDCAGVKTSVCKNLSELCKLKGVHFIGGHPMAGIEKSGFSNSFYGLFEGATMILCRDEHTNEEAFQIAKEFFLSLGFGSIKESDYEEHDAVIAYTSQMAHLVSSAYIKSPTCKKRYGFSAGSFKDLTRVAYLNEDMWTELFLLNQESLLTELDIFIEELHKYRKALSEEDREGLRSLLKEGRICKDTDNRKEAEQKKRQA